MAETWLTADPHYFHKNVIGFCERPFVDVEHMNHELIRRYNAEVGEYDTVYFLGDVIFGGVAKATEILSELRGTKHLIIGNHDVQNKAARWLKLGFATVEESGELEGFKLSHYPYLSEQPDARTFEAQLKDEGGWLLHGHVHNFWKQRKRMINVGVDVWNYAPVNLRTLTAMRDYDESSD